MRINPTATSLAGNIQGLSSQYIQRLRQRQAQGTQLKSDANLGVPAPAAAAQQESSKPAQLSTTSASVAPRTDSFEAAVKAKLNPKTPTESVVSYTPVPKTPEPVRLEAPASDVNPAKQADDVKHPESTSRTATPPAYTHEDLDHLTGAFGKTTGEDGFNAALDLNNDGVLNTLDLVQMLSRLK